MSALPRGTCSVCRLCVPVRRNGTAREHNYQGGPAIGLCKGAGRPVIPEAEETIDEAREVVAAEAGIVLPRTERQFRWRATHGATARERRQRSQRGRS